MKSSSHSGRLLGIFLFFTLLGIIYSWPLVLKINSAIPIGFGRGDTFMAPGDSLESYYFFWNFRDSILKGRSPFFARYHFATGGAPEAVGLTRFPMTLLYFFLSFLGTTRAYNLLTILSFPLTGIFSYLLIRLYTGSWRPALVGSIVATLLPFRVLQLFCGHLNGLVFFLLPLGIYLYELAFQRKQIGWAIGSALVTVALAFSAEVHLLLYYFLLAAAHLLLKLFFLWRERPPKEVIINWLKIAAIIFLGMVLAFGYTYLMKKLVVESSSLAAGRSIREVRIYSAFLTSFFNRRVTAAEIYTYLGIAALGLAVFSLFNLKKTAQRRTACFLSLILLGVFLKINFINDFLVLHLRTARLVYAGAGVIFILVFLLFLKNLFKSSAENPRIFYLSVFVIGCVWSLGSRFPLYQWGYDYVPFIKLFRSPARAMALTTLGLSVLAAYGYQNLENTFKKKYSRNLLLALVLVFLLVDYRVAPGVILNRLEKTNPVFSTVKNDLNPERKVLNLPLLTGSLHQNSLYEYYVILHGHRIINGYHPYPSQAYKQVYESLRNLNYQGPTAADLQLLEKINVRYLVLYRRNFREIPVEYLVFDEQRRKSSGEALFERALSGLRNSPALAPLGAENGIYVFEIKRSS